jgi:hypothetical protein
MDARQVPQGRGGALMRRPNHEPHEAHELGLFVRFVQFVVPEAA